MQIPPDALYPAGGGTPRWRLIDVRSPVEVARGALPWSRNLPLLSDDERHRVGIRYKEAGQEAAIALGYELTAPQLETRIAAWRDACVQTPSAFACWRGGLRSELAQRFTGRDDVPRVTGGTKALRRHLLAELPTALARKRPLVIAGLTGSGKTELLGRLGALDGVQALDLEAAAHHRGSAFGRRDAPQPAQQTFENQVAAELLLAPEAWLLLEDESRSIGFREVPAPVFAAIARAPLLRLETPLAERRLRIHREYVAAPAARLGVDAVRTRLKGDLGRLRQRLGGAALERCLAALDAAAAAGAWFDGEAHSGWIGEVLARYYDPLYRRALARLDRPVAARGTREELTAWIRATLDATPDGIPISPRCG